MTEDQAKQVEENMPLVHFLVRKYYKDTRSLGGYEDKVQIGSIGLCKAVQTFDPENGCTFSTYAAKCIRNEIKQALRSEHAPSRGGADTPLSLDELFGEDAVPLANLIPDPAADTERQLDAQARLRQILKAFDGEPVLLAVATRQMTQQEAADLLGVSQAHVHRRIKAIIEKEENHDQDQHERDSKLP